MSRLKLLIVLILVAAGVLWFADRSLSGINDGLQTDVPESADQAVQQLNPLTIATLRSGTYEGSDFVVEEKLSRGSNYDRFIVSYLSEGNKIYALLTVPDGGPSPHPAIVFNHGYIPPTEYQTTERYVAYVDGFARNGYIVLKSDYRGHGSSEGNPEGAYGSNAYTIDVLHAVASLKKRSDVDSNRIGMWGHSMGGFITLRTMVTTKDIKAGVIWAGVVGSYDDLLNNWRRNTGTITTTPFPLPSGARRWRQALVDTYGTPEKNPAFWNSISATGFLKDISGPIELHHGTADTSVPILFSEKLVTRMKEAGKDVELFTYEGDDHNLANNFSSAMNRSVAFFDKYLKAQ